MNASGKWVIIVLIILIVLCCLISLCVFLVAGGIAAFNITSNTSGSSGIPEILDSFETLVPNTTPFPTPTVEMNLEPVKSEAYETLEILEGEVVPINDPVELAQRLDGKGEIPERVEGASIDRQIGEMDEFWVTNTDTNETVKISATLQYVTDHVYFWIEDDVRFDRGDLKELVETFEQHIYPTNREFFGSEWNPGIDNDPHLYIVYTRGVGAGIAGYFSSADSIHPLAHKFSNAHEMFVLSADNTRLDENFTYGVLAHEFQHMIHWYQDRNESTWLNEGFSELASFLNGYDVGGFDYVFISDPDLQLNDWPNDNYATTPHYGAAFLYVTYFLDRFGEQATQALVANSNNGMSSVDMVLEEINAVDPINGHQITADDVLADWAVANYLLDDEVGDGRYTYQNYQDAPQAYETEVLSTCSPDWEERSVSQYGVDYIRITCPGNYNLTFEGSNEVGILPESPYSGDYAFWSNKGDESDMRLTQSFDFTDVEGSITLKYRTWFDIEADYDYLYLLVSENGRDWEILNTPSGTAADPSGNNYGWGYSGVSGGWITEEVDLSQYAGKEVTLQFEYVTDAAVNGEGLLIDDVEIPEINYFTDFEDEDGGWTGDGFVRVQNRLPQTFKVSMIQLSDTPTVQTFDVQPSDSLSIPVEIGQGQDIVLVVSGTTRFTRQPASYRFSFQP